MLIFLTWFNRYPEERLGFLLSEACRGSTVHVVSVGAQWIEVAIVMDVDGNVKHIGILLEGLLDTVA